MSREREGVGVGGGGVGVVVVSRAQRFSVPLFLYKLNVKEDNFVSPLPDNRPGRSVAPQSINRLFQT